MSDSNGVDRGISPAAGRKQTRIKRSHVAIGVMAICTVIIVITLWKSQHPPEEMETKEKLPPSLGASVAYSPVVLPTAPPLPPPVALPPPPPQFVPPPFEQAQAPPPKPPPKQPDVATRILGPPQQQAAMNVMPTHKIVPNMLSFPERPSRQGPQNRTGQPGGVNGLSPASTGVTYKASRLEGNKADLLGDQTFLLMPGILPCTLETAINSSFEGPILCQVPFRIRPHGVDLLSRGSQIHGWYRNNIQTGQARLFVAADWVHDPTTGCFIKFTNSPMADTLGRAGIDGNVDNHYLERFGAAMLLTLGEKALSIAQAMATNNNGGGNNTYLSFGGGGGGGGGSLQSIATEILRSQINIPPTITVNQGADIAVFVTQPLDFSPCYDVRIKD